MPAKPTIEQLRETAQTYGLHLSDADLESFTGLMDAVLESYRRIDQLPEPALTVRYPRSGGYRPAASENPLNAWYQKCTIKGASTGILAGKRIAIKDNVCVAGVPMMNGSSVLEGYTPEFDATIVTRILDAGGEIVGKAVCEHLCFSGGSHTSDTGPVLNPHDHTRSAGGSSSGSAALVVAGECDMAIGGDQGGSIRIPSCWCGAYGLKPTYGLVPYTGVFPIELTLDHTGPIAATTSDVALLLEAYARGRITRADDLSDTVKLVVLLGQYMQDRYHGRYYAKAQNLASILTKAYNDALQTVDLLVMPTLPMKATRIPPADSPREERVARALEMIANTCPFDVTGHPAMTIPCGLSSGLPVGMMLVGKKWNEATVLRAAHAFERISGYVVRPQQAPAVAGQ